MSGSEPWEGLSFAGRLRELPVAARLMLVGVVCFSLGNGLTLPYLFVYLHDVRDISTTTVGLIVAWMAASGLAAAPLWGVTIDRLGPRSALALALAVEVVGVGSLVWVTGVTQALVSATLVAVGASGAWPAQAALIARLVPSRRRTWLFGVQFMMLNLGIGVGGLIAASFIDVARPVTFQALYVLDAVGYAAYLVVLGLLPAGTGQKEAAEPDSDDRPAVAEPADGVPDGYRALLADRTFLHLVITAVTLILFGYAQLQVGLTAYVTQVAEVPARWMGIAFAANTGAIVVAQLLVIRRLEGRSRSRALASVGLLWGGSWVVLLAVGAVPGIPLAVAVMSASMVIFALGETIWSPTFPALVNDLAPDRLRGRYNAVSSIAWNLGNVLGPVYAGLLIGGGSGTWWPVVTAAGCLGGVGLALRLRHRLSPRQDGREPAGATMSA